MNVIVDTRRSERWHAHCWQRRDPFPPLIDTMIRIKLNSNNASLSSFPTTNSIYTRFTRFSVRWTGGSKSTPPSFCIFFPFFFSSLFSSKTSCSNGGSCSRWRESSVKSVSNSLKFSKIFSSRVYSYFTRYFARRKIDERDTRVYSLVNLSGV